MDWPLNVSCRSQPRLFVHVYSPTAMTTTENIKNPLGLLVRDLSDRNYAQSLVCYRFWFNIGKTYQLPPDQTFDAIWRNRGALSVDPRDKNLIHPTAHLLLRFVSDAESDPTLAPHNSELQSRLCSMTLRDFFGKNLTLVARADCHHVDQPTEREFCADTNLIAHWINLGYVEAVICDHILQSLISHPKLYSHQVDALIVLFKIAGATFGAYADPSVVDRCFELLNDRGSGFRARKELVQVCVPHVVRVTTGLR